MTELSATALYCDDVRMEEGGKLLAVGVYGADIVLSALPQDGIDLKCIVRVFGPIEYQIQFIELEHYYNDEVVFHMRLPFQESSPLINSHIKEMARFKGASKALLRSHPMLLLHGFSPMNIKSLELVGMVSTRVNLGSGFLEAGSIPLIVEPQLVLDSPVEGES